MTIPPTAGVPAVPARVGGTPTPVWPPGAHPPGLPQGGYPVPAPGHPGGPVPQYRAPGPTTPDGRPIATFGERLVAYLVDSVIQTGIVSIVVIPVYFVVVISVLRGGGSGGTFLETLVGLVVFEVVVYTLFSYLYHVEWIRRSGNTVGKKLMKLRVVSLDGSQTPMDRRTLAKRWAVQFVVAAVPFYTYLDGFWQLWDQPYRQCLHDKWPRTVVVKVIV